MLPHLGMLLLRKGASLQAPIPVARACLADDHSRGVADLVGAGVVVAREPFDDMHRPVAAHGGDRALMRWRCTWALGAKFVSAVVHDAPEPARQPAITRHHDLPGPDQRGIDCRRRRMRRRRWTRSRRRGIRLLRARVAGRRRLAYKI